MTTSNPDDEILKTLVREFSRCLGDLFELEFEMTEGAFTETDSYTQLGDVVVTIDFIGNATGLISISGSQASFLNIIEESNDIETHKVMGIIESPFKELLNTMSGKCLRLMREIDPTMTMSAPRLMIGQISYPKIACSSVDLKTDYGEFRLTYFVNKLRIEVAELIHNFKLEDEKNEEMRESYGELSDLCAEILPVWSQQISLSIQQSTQAIGVLTESFLSMMISVNKCTGAQSLLQRPNSLAHTGQDLVISMGDFEKIKTIVKSISGLQAQLNEILISMQFQDRVSQILNHVKCEINRLEGDIKSLHAKEQSGSKGLFHIGEWLDISKTGYSMPEQLAIHEDQDKVDVQLLENPPPKEKPSSGGVDLF